MAVTVPTLFVCFLITFVRVQGTVRLSSRLYDENQADGNRKKFFINLNEDGGGDSGNSDVNEIGKRFRRYLKSNKVKSTPVSFTVNLSVERDHLFRIIAYLESSPFGRL